MAKPVAKTRRRVAKSQLKDIVVNFRTDKPVKALLDTAARTSGRTMSAEIEAQLRRALMDYGAGPTFALMSLIAKVIDNAVKVRGRGRWWEDPYQFALAVRALISTFEMFAPVGEPPADIDYMVVDFGRQSLVRDVQRVVAKPPELQTSYERWLTAIRSDLGPLAYLPPTFGMSATKLHAITASARSFLEEYKMLSRKRAKTPTAMTEVEEARYLVLHQKLAEIAAS